MDIPIRTILNQFDDDEYEVVNLNIELELYRRTGEPLYLQEFAQYMRETLNEWDDCGFYKRPLRINGEEVLETTIECENCGGTGWIEPKFPCRVCQGEGEVFDYDSIMDSDPDET